VSQEMVRVERVETSRQVAPRGVLTSTR